MADKNAIVAALRELDPLNDDHWTADGAPRMDALEALLGDKSVTRKEVVEAAPDFNREKAGTLGDESDEEEGQTNGSQDEEQEDEKQDPEDRDPDSELVIPTGMSEQEFVQWLLTVKADDLPELEETLKDQLNQIVRGIEQARELLAKTRRAVSATRQRIDQVAPKASNQSAINDFIRAQTEARAAKVARRNEILKGVKADELDPRAPIDAAMARKTKRGTQRPVRPILK